MTKNILISGGTGLVGKAIIELLQSKGYNIAILSRTKQKRAVKTFLWDYEKMYIDKEAIEFADIIIHLAGENISSKRWTETQKKKIIDSRVKTTDLLFRTVKEAKKKPLQFISASAVGYYGSKTSDHVFTEEDPPGNDFLARTVVEWENAIDKFTGLGIKTSKLRLGVVMSLKGGALPKMLQSLKMGFASPLGSGKQYIPWIALEDLARMFLFIIEKENTARVYNAVNPQQINNEQLMKYFAQKKSRLFIPIGVPAFIFKILFGEMAIILVEGSRVSSEKIENEGFEFKVREIL